MNIQAKKRLIKDTVKDAINILLAQAEQNAVIHPARAKRYVEMLWALVKKYKIRLTKDQKKKFCRKCLAFLIVDKNAKAIFDAKHNAFYLECGKCGYERRI